MEKRYQVFVSSTYQDLTEERLEVIKALLELDCIPCGMEYFPAASEDSWTYIAQLIEQCDYYVVIIGGRYGSLTSEGVSFTQREYEYALKEGIPSIAFLHSKPDELPAKKTETSTEGRKKLADFIKLLQRHLCKEWSNAHELGAVVSRSITQLIRRHPRIGWIPANQASDPAAARELLQLTKRTRELEDELRKIRGRYVADVTDLADGNEIALVGVYYTVLEPNKEERWPQYVQVKEVATTVEVTWNEIFRAVAPRIAPTSSDAAIRQSVNSVLRDKIRISPKVFAENQSLGNVHISDDWFNILKIQFSALGLLTVLKERAEGGTKGVLQWRLTEKGVERMFQSLAIKKKANEVS